MRCNYLFRVTNLVRFVQSLAVGSRGEQLDQNEELRHVFPKWQGHVVLFLCEIPYSTVLANIIRPVEGYEKSLSKKFVITSMGFPSLKYSDPSHRLVWPFDHWGLKCSKVKFGLSGRAKFTFRPMGIFQLQEGRFLCRARRGSVPKLRDCFGTSESWGRVAWSLYKISVQHNKTDNYKLMYLCTMVNLGNVNFKFLSKFYVWNLNLNNFDTIQMRSLSLVMFSHKTSAKCNKFMTTNSVATNLQKSVENCFFERIEWWS